MSLGYVILSKVEPCLLPSCFINTPIWFSSISMSMALNLTIIKNVYSLREPFCVMCFQHSLQAMSAVVFLLDGILITDKNLTRLLTRFLSHTSGTHWALFIVPVLLLASHSVLLRFKLLTIWLVWHSWKLKVS